MRRNRSGGLTSLKEFELGRKQYNASAQAAVDIGDTVKRIDGTEVPLSTPWLGVAAKPAKAAKPVVEKPAPVKAAKPEAGASVVTAKAEGKKPNALKSARKGKADDLKLILGIGPKLEALCHQLGFFHFDQIAEWTPAEIAWVDENLEGFKGRVTRDKWVLQARILAAGGSVEEAEAAARG